MTIYIVGSGGSLNGFDFDRLKGYDVMAINHMFRFVPFCRHLVAIDNVFYEQFESELAGLACTKHALSKYSDTPLHEKLGLRMWKWRKNDGLDTDPYVAHNWNSGLTGINIALNLGYRDIHLLGFDADSSTLPGINKSKHDYMIARCNMIARQLPDGVKITNHSIGSRITAFNKIDINTIL